MTQHQGATRKSPLRRRATALLTGLAAVGLALTACTPAPPATSPGASGDFTGKDTGAMADFAVGTTFKATEPLSFGLFYRDHPNYPLKEDWLILQQLKENQNVSFDITTGPLAEWDQRKAVVIGAGVDVPDIISVTYPGQEVQFIAGGAILPVSDYLDAMPNFTDKIEKWGLQTYVDTQLKQNDGKFYLLPGLRESLRSQYSYAVRKDIWDELGLSLTPATFDEFKTQLQTVKQAYPDKYPISDRWLSDADGVLAATLQFAAPNFGTDAGWGFGEGVSWNGSAYEYLGATEAYKDLVSYYAGLVADGLMDPESLTQDDDTAIAKFARGDSFVIATNDQETVNRLRPAFEELKNDQDAGVAAGAAKAEVYQMRVPAGPAGDNLSDGGRLVNGLMLSSKVAERPDFKALLQFLDWLYYSDEGLEFAKWGVEGTTYTKDASGKRTLAKDIDISGLNPGAPKMLNVDFGFHNGVWMLEHGSSTELDLSMLRPEVVDFVEAMNTKTQLDLGPAWPLEEMEREEATLWQANLKNIVLQNTAQFIAGQRPLSEWDAYVGELKSNGMDDYLELVNAAQQRRASVQ